MNPNPGEYWYIEVLEKNFWNNEVPEIYLAFIKDNTDKGYFFDIAGELLLIQNPKFVGKWQPNWFWRILGYR